MIEMILSTQYNSGCGIFGSEEIDADFKLVNVDDFSDLDSEPMAMDLLW